MRNQRNRLSDRLGANVSLALRRAQMEYPDGYEVICGAFELFYCVDRTILREELEYDFETVLNSNYLLIGESPTFEYR